MQVRCTRCMPLPAARSHCCCSLLAGTCCVHLPSSSTNATNNASTNSPPHPTPIRSLQKESKEVAEDARRRAQHESDQRHALQKKFSDAINVGARQGTGQGLACPHMAALPAASILAGPQPLACPA